VCMGVRSCDATAVCICFHIPHVPFKIPDPEPQTYYLQPQTPIPKP